MERQTTKYAIIVAGGKGLRMGADIPKQFLLIAGKPVLMHTIERFRQYDPRLNIILVLPREQQEYWRALCKEHHFDVAHTVTDGGDTRFQSSKNGLAAIPKDADGLVAIHDGVRPFVSIDTISNCFQKAAHYGAAIPVMPVNETLRLVHQEKDGHHVDRSLYRTVQTPQVFDINLARKAFEQPFQDCFTDDASVIESMGSKIELTEGNRENIKITTPFDMLVAEALYRKAQER